MSATEPLVDADGERSQIHPLNWVVAVLSAALVCALLYIGNLVTNGLREARVYERFLGELSVDRDIRSKLVQPATKELLPMDDARVQRVADVLALVEEDQLEKAQLRLESSTFPRIISASRFGSKLEELIAFRERLGEQTGRPSVSGELSGPEHAPAAEGDAPAAEERTAAAPDSSALAQRETQLEAELDELGNAMLIELATPQLEPDMVSAYEMFANVAKGRGYDLPELPTR